MRAARRQRATVAETRAADLQRALGILWGPAVVVAMVYLLGRGWFPDLRQPGGDWGRAAAPALLAVVLAQKIAARLSTGERRRTPVRVALAAV
jgi:hypothetical protein